MLPPFAKAQSCSQPELPAQRREGLRHRAGWQVARIQDRASVRCQHTQEKPVAISAKKTTGVSLTRCMISELMSLLISGPLRGLPHSSTLAPSSFAVTRRTRPVKLYVTNTSPYPTAGAHCSCRKGIWSALFVTIVRKTRIKLVGRRGTGRSLPSTSAVNLKFLSYGVANSYRNFKFKTALES